MIITKKNISRRTVLRGVGTALALPFLDAMVPALSAAPRPISRFGAVYVPNGIMMENWTPAAEGASFELTPILKPLEAYRNQMLVVSGLNSVPPKTSSGGAVHARASTRFLTDIAPKPTAGSDLQAGISMDQIAAKALGRHTQLASLEIGLDSIDSAGTGDTGYSRAYGNTISWISPTTPLPMENNPRAVFERMFGESGSTDPVARQSRMKQQRSILDSVTEKIAQIEGSLGSNDRGKLNEYFDAIRDTERRIQNAEEQNTQKLPTIEHPAGIPAAFADHAKLMYDLYALAYQCDLTRVITFMIGQEFCGRTYPELGIHDGHHSISHHGNDPDKLANLVKINSYHTSLFAYFLDRLRSTPDGDGSLLDHSTIVYGAGMSDGNSHDPTNLPILLLGGGSGQVTGGRHVRYAPGTPLANLHLTLLDKLGVPIDRIGDSTGEFKDLFI
jgi:hypothetical protein